MLPDTTVTNLQTTVNLRKDRKESSEKQTKAYKVVSKMSANICVVGGGVVGLTTAVILQQQCPRAQVLRLTRVKHIHTCTIAR